MVHSGVAFAPELVSSLSDISCHDFLDSTAFNVAMFAMGWIATRWAKGKGNEPLLGLHWMKAAKGKGNEPLLGLLKAMATIPYSLLPPRLPSAAAADKAAALKAAALEGDCAIPVSPYCADEAAAKATASEGDCAMAVPPVEAPLLAPENEDADMLLVGLSSLLSRRIASADASDLPPWRRSCFHEKWSSSEMKLSDYMSHTHWFFECSSPCLVVALIYLDRAISRDAKLALCAETCQRLFLTSLLAALKFHDDDWNMSQGSNAFYANIGDVAVEDLNAMEKQFCKSIDWHFYVRPEEYLHYYDLIAAAAPIPSAM